MALAQPMQMEDLVVTTVSDEARRRIGSVRVRQLAYKLMTGAPGLPVDDAEAVAAVVIDAADRNVKVTADMVREMFLARGRDADAADKIIRSVGL